MEFFAGKAHVSEQIRSFSYCGVSLDIDFGRGMDLCKDSGMANLDFIFEL